MTQPCKSRVVPDCDLDVLSFHPKGAIRSDITIFTNDQSIILPSYPDDRVADPASFPDDDAMAAALDILDDPCPETVVLDRVSTFDIAADLP